MAKKAASKCKPTECEECPEWIFTFADLVMLMMGFFVILWVLKPPPGKHAAAELDDIELVKFIASIRDYFDFIPDTVNPDKVDLFRLLKKIEEMKPFKGPGDGGKTKLEKQAPVGTEFRRNGVSASNSMESIRTRSLLWCRSIARRAPSDAEATLTSMRSGMAG